MTFRRLTMIHCLLAQVLLGPIVEAHCDETPTASKEGHDSELPLPPLPMASGWPHSEIAVKPVDVTPIESSPKTTVGDRLPLNDKLDLERQAAAHLKNGFLLGGRNALFAARAELIRSLAITVQLLDASTGTTAHSRSLARGLKAFREADDFVAGSPSPLDADQLAAMVERHDTPLLKQADLRTVPALIARQQYLNFAEAELARAVQSQPIGALALHGLAKVDSQLAAQRPEGQLRAQGKAIALERASLAANPRNFRAANDLAVLYCHQGRLAEAKSMLRLCAREYSDPIVWKNLAAVHAQLGERRQAELARAEATRAPRQATSALDLPTSGQPNVQWLAPQAFAASSSGNVSDSPASEPNSPSRSASTDRTARSTSGKGRWK